MNFNREDIQKYEKNFNELVGMGSYSYVPKKLDLDLKNRLSPTTKPLIEEPLLLELKDLPGNL